MRMLGSRGKHATGTECAPFATSPQGAGELKSQVLSVSPSLVFTRYSRHIPGLSSTIGHMNALPVAKALKGSKAGEAIEFRWLR